MIQSGQYGEGLDRVTLTYDDELDEVAATAAEVLPIVSTEYEATNAEVNQIVDDAVAFAAEAGAVPLGTITTDILRAVDEDGDENRMAESVLGNFIADVQLAQTAAAADAEIAFMNPGGRREDFRIDDQFGDEACGVVTLGEANAVQPFANAVVTKTYTRAEIWATLQQQFQPDDADRPFLALGVSEGLFFAYDTTTETITEVSLNGEPIPNDDSEDLPGDDQRVPGLGWRQLHSSWRWHRCPAARADGETLALNVSGATCPAAAPPPGDDGADDGQNPGLGVDTGVTGSTDQGWIVGGLLLVLAAGGAVVVARREKAVC